MKDIREGIFYHIYPIGFCSAPEKNMGEPPVNRIEKVEKWIPHMKNLGVNCIYFGPVFESGLHGYDTHDYRKIDTRLGTSEDFAKVCRALRNEGFHIILDGVFNHVGRGFFAFEDLLKNRENSQYRDWFSGLDFGRNNSYGDGFRYDSWAGYESLVKLNLRNPQVKNYLLDSVKMWMEDFGIEGLRLDAADVIDHDFFRDLRRVTAEKDPDFWLMGEIIHGNYCVWVNDEMLHSVTNYECYKGIHSSITSKNLFEIMSSLDRQNGPWGLYKNMALYNFLDNHDVNRIASVLKNHRENLKNAYTILFTMPGVPSIYYGSEWGITGEKANHSDLPLRPAIDVENPEIVDADLMEHIKMLAKERLSSKALMKGSFERLNTQNEIFAFGRSFEEENAVVFVNIASEQKTLSADFKGRHFEETLAPYTSKIVKF
ncbi:MAG: alpha-amylase family glycosyl hydrolase [Eubacteriales bacterium]|nr:alpha-amylase family glycosyl hydrolase [Eubacteriales bacterium]